MNKAKLLFDKYGIRFGVTFLVAAAIQAARGDWDWADFVGRCFATGLVVAATYPVEAWFKKHSAYCQANHE